MSLSDAFNVGPVADPDAYAAGLSALPDYSVGQSVQVPDGPQFGPPPPVPANVQAMDAAAGLGPPVNPGAWSGAPPAPSPGIMDYNVGLEPPAPVAANVPQVAGAALVSPGASAPIVPSAPAPLYNPGATAAIGPFAKGGMFDPTRKRATYHMGPHGEQVPDWSGEPAPPVSPLDKPPSAPPKPATSAASPAVAASYGGEIDDYVPPKVVFKKGAEGPKPQGEWETLKDGKVRWTGPASAKPAGLGEEMAAETAGADVPDVGKKPVLTPAQSFSQRQHLDVDLAQQRGLGEMAVAGEQAKGAENESTKLDKMTDEDLQTALDRKKRDAALMAEDEEQSKKARDFQLDPGRYMHNASFLQKAFLLIGAAAGGVARGIKGGTNSTLDGLNQMIDRDIAQQKGQYEQMRARGIDIHNQWSMNLRKDQNEDAQKEIMKAQTLRAIQKHTLSQVTQSQIAGPIADAAIQTANNAGKMADLSEAQALALQQQKGGPKRETAAERNKRVQALALALYGKGGVTWPQAVAAAKAFGTDADLSGTTEGPTPPLGALPERGSKASGPTQVPVDVSAASTAGPGSWLGRIASAVGLESASPEVADRLRAQEDYNNNVTAMVKTLFSTRGPQAEAMYANLRVHPGDDQATIDRKAGSLDRLAQVNDPEIRKQMAAQMAAGFKP